MISVTPAVLAVFSREHDRYHIASRTLSGNDPYLLYEDEDGPPIMSGSREECLDEIRRRCLTVVMAHIAETNTERREPVVDHVSEMILDNFSMELVGEGREPLARAIEICTDLRGRTVSGWGQADGQDSLSLYTSSMPGGIGVHHLPFPMRAGAVIDLVWGWLQHLPKTSSDFSRPPIRNIDGDLHPGWRVSAKRAGDGEDIVVRWHWAEYHK